MFYKVFVFSTAIFLGTLANPAFADIHKCVAADGSSSYTDQPCATSHVEKSLDSSISSLDNQNAINHGCANLDIRRAHCGGNMYYLLQSTFRNYCANPLQQNQRDQPQYHPVNRYVSNKERMIEAQDNARQVPISDFRCESIQKDTWSFLKENFGKKISAHDSKDIEYNIQAVPGDGRDARRMREGMRD